MVQVWFSYGSGCCSLIENGFSVGSEVVQIGVAFIIVGGSTLAQLWFGRVCGVIISGSVVIQRWSMVGSDLVQLGVVRCALGQQWVR